MPLTPKFITFRPIISENGLKLDVYKATHPDFPEKMVWKFENEFGPKLSKMVKKGGKGHSPQNSAWPLTPEYGRATDAYNL